MEGNKSNVGSNALKLAGERLMPGASQMMEGKVASGGAHLIVSTLARSLFGPMGVALVVANSLSNSTTGQGLLKNLRGGGGGEAAAPAPAPEGGGGADN